eukprot:32484-Prymnesium_polylepis.2
MRVVLVEGRFALCFAARRVGTFCAGLRLLQALVAVDASPRHDANAGAAHGRVIVKSRARHAHHARVGAAGDDPRPS